MMRLDYRAGIKPFPWAGVALLVFATAILGLSAKYYNRTVERTAYWEARSGQITEGSRKQTEASKHDMEAAALEIRNANEVLRKLTIPWDSLFRALEWSSGQNVALLAIEPDAEKHQVKISGEAKDISALWNYMGHLEAQPAFRRVILRRHQVERRELTHPVRFALIVEWGDSA